MSQNADTYSELKEVQKRIIYAARQVLPLCSAENLCIFALGGTLLGAVRHKGIIPWDDDIDFGMPFDDYRRFLDIAPSLLPPNLFLSEFRYDDKHPQVFAKVFIKNTTFLEKEYRHIKTHHCLFIDIFPYTYLPSNYCKRRKAERSIRFWNELFKSKSLWRVSSLASSKKQFLGNVLRPLLHLLLLPVPKKWIYKKLWNCLERPNPGLSSFLGTLGNEKTALPTEAYFPVKYASFEGFEVPIPARPGEVLTKTFGDYMTPPPESSRVGHRPYLIDLNRDIFDEGDK